MELSCQNIEIFIVYTLPMLFSVHLKVGLSAVREVSRHANDRFR